MLSSENWRTVVESNNDIKKKTELKYQSLQLMSRVRVKYSIIF